MNTWNFIPLTITQELTVLDMYSCAFTYTSKDSGFVAGEDGVGLLKQVVHHVRHQISKPALNILTKKKRGGLKVESTQGRVFI